MSQWIKCSESLPIERESFDPTSTVNVLVADDHGCVSVAFWTYEGLCWADANGDEIDEESFGNITHWMPLPKAPNE